MQHMIHVYGFYPVINSFYLVYSQEQVKMTYLNLQCLSK